MIDITAQTTELLAAALTVLAIIFLVMTVSWNLTHMLRKDTWEG